MIQPTYCEKPFYSAFFEPVNTLTNLFFIFAGIHLLVLLKRNSILDYRAVYLSVILIFLGLGSFAWHFYRTSLTFAFDSIPIAVFVVSYLWFYIEHTVKKIFYRTLFFIGFFIYVIALTKFVKQPDNAGLLGNGGLKYMAAISYFALLQIYNFYNKRGVVKKSLFACLLFSISFFFRQADLLFCDKIPFGTHFLWHFFNAIVLYLFVRLLYLDKLAIDSIKNLNETN